MCRDIVYTIYETVSLPLVFSAIPKIHVYRLYNWSSERDCGAMSLFNDAMHYQIFCIMKQEKNKKKCTIIFKIEEATGARGSRV